MSLFGEIWDTSKSAIFCYDPWALMLNLRWIGSAGPPLFATASSSPASWDFYLPSKMSSCERLRQCLCTLHATMERLGCGCKALKASNPSRTGFVQKLQMFVLFLPQKGLLGKPQATRCHEYISMTYNTARKHGNPIVKQVPVKRNLSRNDVMHPLLMRPTVQSRMSCYPSAWRLRLLPALP